MLISMASALKFLSFLYPLHLINYTLTDEYDCYNRIGVTIYKIYLFHYADASSLDSNGSVSSIESLLAGSEGKGMYHDQ